MEQDHTFCDVNPVEGEANEPTPQNLFDRILRARDLLDTLETFYKLCQSLDVDPRNHRTLYSSLKSKLTSWKCQSLWNKLDKRANHKDFSNKPCSKNKVLVIGAGPCGLRVAVEAALLGAQVVVVEKRDQFSRNNVLHLWPFLINDLKNLGAKKFFGQFCAGAIDHISIRMLELILLKISLFFGVQVYPKCMFEGLIEPDNGCGWRANIRPANHPVKDFEFDIIVGADGKRNSLPGFKRKEFRGKLAIGITVNFKNRRTQAEAMVEEISGVAFIFNQKFFQDLKETAGIDLENIVYYKDETHYFVMTAKKQSLLAKGVIIQDFTDAEMLLKADNVCHEKLLEYAKEAAEFSTNYKLPNLEFARNHYGREDVAMFDFTSLFAAENACRIVERGGCRLLMCIVGDTLLEPFWPTGSGCARGFLGCFDAAWLMRGWGLKRPPLELIVERQSILQILAQTTPNNLGKNYDGYSIDPSTRYPNLNRKAIDQNSVLHLYDRGEGPLINDEEEEPLDSSLPVMNGQVGVNMESLLDWCKKCTKKYNVDINDLSTSWKNGIGFCAIIHYYRPDLIDFSSVTEENPARNVIKAFDAAELNLGIQPPMSAKDFVSKPVPDRLMVLSYLSQFYETFKDHVSASEDSDNQISPDAYSRSKSPFSKLSIITRFTRKSKKEKRRSEDRGTNIPDLEVSAKKPKSEIVKKESEPVIAKENVTVEESAASLTHSKATKRISAMAEQLFGNWEPSLPAAQPPRTGDRKISAGQRSESDFCYFCKKKVYIMERLTAEGLFFHRSCFKCEHCATTLRLGTYAFLPSNNEGEMGKFYCKPHFRRYYYGTDKRDGAAKVRKLSTQDEGEETKTKQRPRSVSIDMDIMSLEATMHPVHSPIPPSPEPEVHEAMDVVDSSEVTKKEHITPEAAEIKIENADFRKYRKYEARPLLRRSSIASVRKSDESVRRRIKVREMKLPVPTQTKLVSSKKTPAPLPPGKEEISTKEEVPTEKVVEGRKEPEIVSPDDALAAVRKAARAPSGGVKMREDNVLSPRRAMYPASMFFPDDAEPLPDLTQANQIIYKEVEIPIDDVNVTTGESNQAQEAERPLSLFDERAPYLTVVDIPLESSTEEDKSVSISTEVEEEKLKQKRMAPAPPLVAPATAVPKDDKKYVTSKEATKRAIQKRKPTPKPVHSKLLEGKKAAEKAKEKQEKEQKWRKKEKEKKEVERKKERSGKVKASDSKTVNKERRLLHDESLEEQGFVIVNKDEFEDLVEDQGQGREVPLAKAEDEDFELLSSPEKAKLGEMASESSDEGEKGIERMSNLKRTFAKRTKRTTEEEMRLRSERKQKKHEQEMIMWEMKQRETKRLRMAQAIQRELEEVEVKQQEMEKKGIAVEEALRSDKTSPEDEHKFMLQWFNLVHEKNILVRYESELVIHANSIELEDRQGRLELEIRELLTKEDCVDGDQIVIDQLTHELVDIVEQRNKLVQLLEEDRLREQEEDQLFQSMMDAKDKSVKRARSMHNISFITAV